MRPERDKVLLHTAFLWAERSTCERLHVGAVFARDGRILVQGYNGAPAGMAHCDHTCNCDTEGYPYFVEENDEWVHRSFCRAPLPCTSAVHAEQNAISYAARWGVELEGSILYCTHQPCLNCAMSIVNVGVKAVIFSEEYRLKDGIRLLETAGVKVLRHSNPTDRINE